MYNYNSIDNFLQTNRMKTAYFDAEMASSLYDAIENFVIISEPQKQNTDQSQTKQINKQSHQAGEIWDAVKDVGGSIIGKGIKGVGNLAQKGYNNTKNLIQNSNDEEVPTTHRELTKMTCQEFKDFLKERNNYYSTNDINAIYNFIATYLSTNPNAKGAIYNIPKEEFISSITKACPYKEEWENEIRNFLSNTNLNKLNKDIAKVFNSLKLQSYTDAVKNGLFNQIKAEFPQSYGVDFSTAEVRMGFLKAQQDAQQDAINISLAHQENKGAGLIENKPKQEPDKNQETMSQIILDETLDKSDDKYLQYKEQYDIFLDRFLKDKQTGLKRINSIIDRIIPKQLKMTKGYLQNLNTPIDINSFKDFNHNKKFHKEIEEEVNTILDVFEKTMSAVYKEIKCNSENIKNKYNNPTYKKSLAIMQEAIEYMVYYKIKKFLEI